MRSKCVSKYLSFVPSTDVDTISLVKEQKLRATREKKAKAATSAASQPKLLQDEGDGFMYGPAESYAPPTLTGGTLWRLVCRFLLILLLDDDSDEAEAKHIMKLLAYRGDGDWQVQYQERQIELEDLRQARDNPGSDLLKRKVKKQPSTSAKGKARALDDDEHEGEAASSWHETIYTGVSIFLSLISTE